MKLTNNSGLPQAFVRAAENDQYTKGESDFSVTELLSPARQRALRIKHYSDITEDARDRVWSLFGQATHSILERGARPDTDIVERRYFGQFGPYTLSGQVDLYSLDDKTISDWKVTKAFAFVGERRKKPKPEYAAQLNMQAHLLRMNGESPERAFIVAILKDWDYKQASKPGYPEAEVIAQPIKLEKPEKVDKFINERIIAHVNAEKDLPQCSPSETWFGVRCQRFCDVSKYCDQYQKSKQTGVI